MKNTNKGFIVPVLIAIVVLAIAGGVYYASSKKVVVEDEPIKVESTADWKTYKNDEYGFQFNYPSDWVLQSARESSPIPTQKGSISFEFKTPKPNDTLIIFSFGANANYAGKGFSMPYGYAIPNAFKAQYEAMVTSLKFTN